MMKMKWLGIVLGITSGSAFASSNAYELKMELAIDGKQVVSPHLIVREGEPATFTRKSGSESTSP